MTNINKTFTCNFCPRKCNNERTPDNGNGFCHSPSFFKVARYSLHQWEEPCISGTNGSGTIFFSGCNLGCIYCQNKDIALGQKGKIITQDELVRIMLYLEKSGAHNINLVTASHYIHLLPAAIIKAKESGLTIPIVYNTSSYEDVHSIKQLDGLIDIYLPDYKYISSETASKYSFAPDYPDIALKAITEMVRQTKEPTFDCQTGLLKKGTIIRHLILPLHTSESKELIKSLFNIFGDNVYISLMSQYTPPKSSLKYNELNRKLTPREYSKVLDYAIMLGITNCFFQEGDTAKDSFIPEFYDDITIPN